MKVFIVHLLSLQFFKFRYNSESTKERNKVNIHAETLISWTLKITSLFYTDSEQFYEPLDHDFKSLKFIFYVLSKKNFLIIKHINYFRIDISYLVFDVTDSYGNYYQFKNKVSGFKSLQSSQVVKTLRYGIKGLTIYLNLV